MDDRTYMRMALEAAGRTEGGVSPRPPVGAVVVAGDTVVGEGWCTPSPGPHAEAMALEAAGERAHGATVYVTLEPCAHTGATPPCARALIEHGVKRVIIGVRDPNPKVDGNGLGMLEEAGIEVKVGVLREACRRLIEPFTSWALTGSPFVTLKLAATLDGKVAAPDGSSRWITGPQARAEVHELRRRVDAVMVGSRTIQSDDPSLTARTDGEVTQPLRVVLDSSGRTSVSARVFDGSAPVLIVTREGIAPEHVKGWRLAGAEVSAVAAGEDGVDVRAALTQIGRRGACHVLCEGGPTLASSLVSSGVVGHLVLYLAPKLVGGDAPGLLTSGVKTLSDAWDMRIERVRRVGEDIRVDARPSRPKEDR